MADISTETQQSILLNLFKRSSDGRVTAGVIMKKLKIGTNDGPDGSEADRSIADLIEQGLIAVSGGAKKGHHPRPNASYRLSDKGRHQIRPARPDFSDEQLQNQEAFILLQVFRLRGRS